jgi:hypothetical protein
MKNPTYINPYRSYNGQTIRLNLDAPADDVNTIRLVLLEHGGLQTAQALFLKHLADYARTNNYTIADRDAFITYILNKCGCSEGCTNSNPSRGNDGRTAPRVRKVHKGAENVATAISGE